MGSTPAVLTIVVPTFNEEGNVDMLVRDIRSAMSGVPVRILFVDDSPPAGECGHSLTVLAIKEAVVKYGSDQFVIDYIHRRGDDRKGSIASAVIRGFREADSHDIAVMDADGQHPPRYLRAMHAALTYADIVVASRYTAGGDSGGLGSPFRKFISRMSTWLAKGLFPRELSGRTDPMTGCFMVRRDAIKIDTLSPEGWKILLEILLTHPHLRYSEVPIRFEKRRSGESKAVMKQGIIYLRQLAVYRLSSQIR
jgi:dolichol-phosphate mannosyltransferase